MKREEVKINLGKKPERLEAEIFSATYRKRGADLVRKYYACRGKVYAPCYQNRVSEVAEAKKRAVEAAASGDGWEWIEKYLRLIHPSLCEEWNNVEWKRGVPRGDFLFWEFLAIGGGFFLLKQVWGNKYKGYTNYRKNYIFCGWTEMGFLFAHPITGQIAHLALKKGGEWYKYVLEKIWRGNLGRLAYRQGEWGLIRKKTIPPTVVESLLPEKENHLFRNMIIFRGEDGKEYALALEGAHVEHGRGRHTPVNVEAGVYELVTTREADVWDFGRAVD